MSTTRQLRSISRGLMKLIIIYFLSAVFFASNSSASEDLLPKFNNRWDGDWSSQYEELETFYRLKTAATIAPSFIEYVSETPFSFERKFLSMRLRINSAEAWGGLEVRISSDDDYKNYYSIAIPFYSDKEFNIVQANHWADYTLTLGEARRFGKPDLQKIRRIGFYVQGQNVNPSELFTVDFAHVTARTSLHSGIVSFTFDDGYAEQFQAAQIMGDYGLRGTAYVMTNEMDQTNYLTSAQVRELAESYHWGISSHHFKPITEMTEAEFFSEMDKTINVLTSLGRGNDIAHFAYPLGKQSRDVTLPWIRSKFLTARVAGGGAETLPPSDWHMLKTFNVTPDISAKDLLKRVELAKQNNEWLILMFHRFTKDSTSTKPLVYPFKQFEKLCKGMVTTGIPVHPVHEVYEAFHE
jgi:peptidoglycan/xylan/chitin deacetylase (PgdA/CDA1 family)